MRYYFFNAIISTSQCYGFYSGEVKNVLVTADNGERVQLAFRHFTPFVETNGVRGRFRLTVSDTGAFIKLEKIN
jgi:hypothetical protein